MSLVSFEHVSKYFLDGEQKVSVLEDINFSINSQDFITLVGVSGSGKTTFLNMMAGIEPASLGQIIHTKKFNIGYVTQQAHFIDELSIRDNLVFSCLKRKDFSDIERYSQYFECSTLLNKKPRHLSGGEKQRFNIIRALLVKPDMIILDEPTASLDYENKIKVIEILNNIYQQEHLSVILVTHDRDLIHLTKHTQIVELKNRQLHMLNLTAPHIGLNQ